MVLYDWQKIYRAANGRAGECARIFAYVASGEVPTSRKDPMFKYARKRFDGGSFLINPERLISNYFRYTNKEIAVYLTLASLRNLGEYIASNKTSLDVLHAVIDSELYNKNRLLYILDDEIHFIYEEAT